MKLWSLVPVAVLAQVVGGIVVVANTLPPLAALYRGCPRLCEALRYI